MVYYIAVDEDAANPNPHAWVLDTAVPFDSYDDAEDTATKDDHEDGQRFGVPVLTGGSS